MNDPVVQPVENLEQAPVHRGLSGNLRGLGLILVTGLSVSAFYLAGQVFLVFFCLALGGLWATGFYRKDSGFGSVFLFGYTGAAAYGLIQGTSPLWMLAVVLFALATWDLDGFSQRLREVEGVEMTRRLEQAHLKRLGVLTGAGLLFPAMILSLHFRLPLALVIGLGLLAMYGLAQLVSFLRRESD